MPVADLYREDLAFVHIEGYGFHCDGAAQPVLDLMRSRGMRTGVVVDLGCGGGEWLRRLAEAGYAPVGVDVSEAMIQASRRRAPTAQLIHGSFAECSLPPCDVCTSLGEPLNYLDGARSIQRTMKNVYRALRPGGLFIFDVRHPATKPVPVIQHGRSGETWACCARIEERKHDLVRYITTFRQVGRHYRRSEEIHRLKIFAAADVTRWLRRIGFRVQRRRGYGDYALTSRQSVFICSRPL